MTDDDRDGHGVPQRDFSWETANIARAPLNGGPHENHLTQIVPRPWGLGACNEQSRPLVFDLGELWRGLRAGAWRFRDTFSSSERHFAVLERIPAGNRSRVEHRNLEILNRVLLGQLPKVVAHDLKIAISTVATGTQHCLHSLGLPKRPSSLPVLLMMAARAAECVDFTPALGRLTRIKANNEKYWLVSVERPDLQFPVALSEAESLVVRQLVSGRTHAEISTDRATSPRTVANQLASAFKKFGVSGRSAIVQRLITHSFERQAARLGASHGPLFSLPASGTRALNGS